MIVKEQGIQGPNFDPIAEVYLFLCNFLISPLGFPWSFSEFSTITVDVKP